MTRITRGVHIKEAIVALGGNIGDTESAFDRAIEEISQSIGSVIAKSQRHRTEPLAEPGKCAEEQPKYLNAIVVAITELAPDEILRRLLEIETKLGRKRDPERRWGPRVIDLDLIAVDELVVDKPQLVLPHPEMHKRDFVLVPLAEVCPQWRHPRFGRTVRELLEECGKNAGAS